MSEAAIDLSSIKFLDSDEPLFKGRELLLSSKNFIFAKNGSGKSTLSNAILEQKSEEFDIQVFKGFDGLIGEKDNFEAFSLAVDAGEKELEIKKYEKKLEQKNIEKSISEKDILNPEEGRENLFSKLEQAKKNYFLQRAKLDKFCTDSARSIVKFTTPVLVENARSYNKNFFKKEIQKANESYFLQVEEVKQLNEVLESNSYILSKLQKQDTDFSKYLISINEILSSKVEEHKKIKRLNSQKKINFANEGLLIHQKGDVCAFCGNEILDETFDELSSYFSADEVKNLQKRINKGKISVQQQLQTLDSIQISSKKFYPNILNLVNQEIKTIQNTIEAQRDFFKKINEALETKEKNLFIASEPLDILIPENINFTRLNQLIEENNHFSRNLLVEKENARKKLRYHNIKLLLEKFHFDTEIVELKNLEKLHLEKQDDFNKEKVNFENLVQEISELEKSIDLLRPKAEKQAIERINKKLRLKVSWELDFYENENTGYYMVKERNKTRSVKKLSTGEKNIIAFLYFIEKLEEVRKDQNRKPKLIVFDDPMSSNDDTMQYLIICELQRLYQGKERAKYDVSRDIIVILTHNVHFYLNVQPHGNYKDGRNRTKYDKNNFYRIDNHRFVKITTEKEDFKTSYEALWIELKDLYECGHENSMLNSMRRIIETYMQFNCLKQEDFYKGNQQYLKLFNVHSHSIDDYSAESFTENKEDMKKLFYQIFKDNGCERHFRKYWEIE